MKSSKSAIYKGIKHLRKDKQLREELSKYYKNSIGTDDLKISQFPKYVRELDLRNFLFKVEIFKKILGIHGSIIEMGVLFGGGLMSWAKLSSIFESVNYSRKIIGFDTFSGFTTVSSKDKISKSVKHRYSMKSPKKREFFADSYNDILKSIEFYNLERHYAKFPKIELIKGDITKTLPKYLKENPHTVVSLLSMDLDLYKPTKIALKLLLPRMTKGSIVCFDEVNHPNWPGETLALIDEIGFKNVKLQRFDFAPSPSYLLLG